MCFVFSCVFILLVSIISFHLEELLSAFLVRRVWWRWTPSVFVCLGNLYLTFISEGQPCWLKYSWLEFSLGTLTISSHSLLASKISAEKWNGSLTSFVLLSIPAPRHPSFLRGMVLSCSVLHTLHTLQSASLLHRTREFLHKTKCGESGAPSYTVWPLWLSGTWLSGMEKED